MFTDIYMDIWSDRLGTTGDQDNSLELSGKVS